MDNLGKSCVSLGKMTNFLHLALFFHLPLPRIWHSHPLYNYFFEKYKNRAIITQSFILTSWNVWHLKSVKEIIANSLSDVLNTSILTKIFPDDFNIAKGAPIPKGGEVEDVGNHRPISILASVAGIYEKLLYKQLYDFLSKNEILNSKQWGFRSLHCTALNLIDCSSKWLINIDKGETNLTVFLDIKKAFDTNDQNILLRKLNHYVISDTELQFFGYCLRNRKQCCNINS